MKKIVAIFLAVLMLVGLTACKENKYAHGSEETVLKIGDHKVSEEVYRYFLLNTMDEMAGDDENYFSGADKGKRLSELDAKVLTHLKQFYAIYDLAKNCDIEMSEKQLEDIHSTMAAMRADYETADEYQKELDAVYLSE